MPQTGRLCLLLTAFLASRAAAPCSAGREPAPKPFEIQVVDDATGRGVPLVELETIDNVRHVTDNAGRVAFDEAELAGQTLFFFVHSQGYQPPVDGFGIKGFRIQYVPGGRHELRLKRLNVAERLYRVTGQGLYRDTLRLGRAAPLREPQGPAFIAGQDSVQRAVYRDKIYWFWGDTNRLSYPLGLFRTAGATSNRPGAGGLPADQGIDFTYFTGPDGFARNMADVPDPQGVVWIDGVCTVRDGERERLVGHFSRRKGLADELEHGLVVYNDDRDLFEVAARLELTETWRHLQNRPILIAARQFEPAGSMRAAAGPDYLACGSPFPVVRVPAAWDRVREAANYEAFTCLHSEDDPQTAKPRRNAQGEVDWGWRAAPPVTPEIEARWLAAREIRPEEARFSPADFERPERRIRMHNGTVHWNGHRRRWVLIANEIALRPGIPRSESPSLLGEVWYSEAESPTGPFRVAVRVVTHDRQSFYNPCHHPVFDEDGGRRIYFEGTYCNTFTNAPPTPRYNYNQVMYRLDLDHPVLTAAFPR